LDPASGPGRAAFNFSCSCCDNSGVDIGAIVRDFTKWDDQPASLQHFAESAVRAYKIATTPRMGPVFLALGAELLPWT
jgi:thiamine pyrophosphate-dependent acetolactate synthase large subunit-like protein